MRFELIWSDFQSDALTNLATVPFSAPPRFRTLTDGFGIHHATVTPETLMLVPPQRFELRPDTLEECCTSVIRKGQIKDDK